MKHILTAGALAVGLSLSLPPPAIAAPSADTTLDVTQNPGCGLKGLTSRQKVERNRRLAELFFQAYSQAPKYGHLYNWTHHGCFAADVAMYSWLAPAGAPPQVAPEPLLNPQFFQNEWQLLRKAMPDFGVVPGSLKIFPWDRGVTFRLDFSGRTPAGVQHRVWESGTILVNDAGKITYWEFWDDTKAIDGLFKAAFGMTGDEIKANPQKLAQVVMSYSEGQPVSK